MRGVSIPTHEYSRVAEAYIPLMDAHPSRRDPDGDVSNLTAAARAFTRVVLRLRVQAEKESAVASSATSQRSAASYSQSQVHLAARPTAFKSPLYHMRRAPLLRVFVPSPDGDWLSDTSVLECEAELKRAGVQHLLRMGDVVWDIALGDEGNVGRLVWDGSFLIDLDYTYSAVGDLPNKYLPNLAFPPSYFHRVIRTGPNSGNPIVRFDLRPWTDDILSNLQLLQDRVRTETPQGHYHNVVRWVHRSSFVIRPNNVLPTSRKHTHQARIPIPNSNLFVDPGWYGTVIIETEGTNEALAELRQALTAPKDLLVFRIVRERSRPGEIMIKRETSRS
ncbi:hypothetical protein C8J56DRAFT_782229 [Mycena floridula]|nr:hypothetical protein C8J56DRAFT_782229 [Mycena floridula]